jgi:hypothetical protein
MYTVQCVRGGGVWGHRRGVLLLVNFSEKPTFGVCCLYIYLVYASALPKGTADDKTRESESATERGWTERERDRNAKKRRN